MKSYLINEIFYEIQGEGVRAGTMNVFVRFSRCNLKCSADDANGVENNVGFFCDSEYESGQKMSLEDIEKDVMLCQFPASDERFGFESSLGELRPHAKCRWLVLTGGEPALQVDKEFCDYFHERGYKLAIETNGTFELPRESFASEVPDLIMGQADSDTDVRKRLICYLVDWICVSPKSAEHTIRQTVAHEVKYVRNADQSLPKPSCKALHYILSPAFSAATIDNKPMLDKRALQNCMKLCRENPEWRLSLQVHKFLGVR